MNDGEISVNITMFCNQYIDGSKQGVQLSDSKIWKNYIDTYHKVLNGISEKDKEKMIIRNVNRLTLDNKDLSKKYAYYFMQNKLREDTKSKDEKCFNEYLLKALEPKV